MKRVGKQLTKEARQAAKKELVRILAERKALIKRLEGMLDHLQLAQIRRQIESTLNSVRSHLKDSELTGALRDRRGDPVRATGHGRVWDHDQEAIAALMSLNNLRTRINRLQVNQMRRGATEEVKMLSKAADEIQAFRSRVQRFLENNS